MSVFQLKATGRAGSRGVCATPPVEPGPSVSGEDTVNPITATTSESSPGVTPRRSHGAPADWEVAAEILLW